MSTTYDQLKAAWLDDRASLGSKCPHEWAITRTTEYSRIVTCKRCEKRPHCAPSIFDSRQRTNGTHSQGESLEEAMGKARIVYALSGGKEQVEPVVCKHCGFWTIRDVVGERVI